MPELPEVETVCRGLQKHIVGRTITKVVVRSDSAIHDQKMAAEDFRACVEGRKICGVRRRGKYILLDLNVGCLICHLRMTGKLLVRTGDVMVGKHDHVIFYLDDAHVLLYEDVRRFGGFLWCAGDAMCNEPLSKLGPEPLEATFNADDFFKSTRKRKRPIKTHLLDQHIVAGIGNIYADEILFAAGVRPRKSAMRISRAEAAAIVDVTKRILAEAVMAGGSTIRDYVDSENREGTFQLSHQVYGRAGEPCKQCGTVLKSITVGGRSSVYCPNCQKS